MSSSVTEFIKSRPVFTSEQLLNECGNSQNTRNLLYRAHKAGKVLKVKRGLYASNAGRYEGIHPPYQLIASLATPDAVLCHTAAFSLFLGNQDIVTRVPFYSSHEVRPFEFQGFRYEPLTMPKKIEVKEYRLANGEKVLGTTKEQTVIDSLSHPSQSGGIESVMRRLSALRYLNVKKAEEIATVCGPSACARLGWLLESRPTLMGSNPAILDELKADIGEGPYYLGSATEKVAFNKTWRLYLPYTDETLREWLSG